MKIGENETFLRGNHSEKWPKNQDIRRLMTNFHPLLEN